jgi:hypothetical protein
MRGIVKCPRIAYTDLNSLFCKVLDGPRRSADHLGRLEEQGWRDGEAECLGGLQVDDQLERRGPLHRQVTGLVPFRMRST